MKIVQNKKLEMKKIKEGKQEYKSYQEKIKMEKKLKEDKEKYYGIKIRKVIENKVQILEVVNDENEEEIEKVTFSFCENIFHKILKTVFVKIT